MKDKKQIVKIDKILENQENSEVELCQRNTNIKYTKNIGYGHGGKMVYIK